MTDPRRKGAVVRFIVVFLVVSAAGVGLEYYLMARNAAQGYRALVAGAGNWLPRILGIDSQTFGTKILVAARALEVTPECSGIEAMGIFCAGVLAFPCRRKSKAVGLAMGLVGVGVLNILRVSGLVVVAAWGADWFARVHDALTHLFPLFAVLPLWLAWLLVTHRRSDSPPGAADTSTHARSTRKTPAAKAERA